MDDRNVEGKRSLKEKTKDDFPVEDDLEDDVEEEEGGSGCFIDEDQKKKGADAVSGKRGVGLLPPLCQVEMCGADLTDGKRYHRRHKVCEVHAKAFVALVAGIRQRFCQQCSRFHELSEFDEAKRSCRRHLAGHNERRRKSLAETCGEGSSRKGFRAQLKDGQHRPAADRGSKYTPALPGNTACRWPQIK